MLCLSSGFVCCVAVAYDSVVSEDLESALPTYRKMVALYDYNPQRHSPNADSEVVSLILRLKTTDS